MNVVMIFTVNCCHVFHCSWSLVTTEYPVV